MHPVDVLTLNANMATFALYFFGAVFFGFSALMFVLWIWTEIEFFLIMSKIKKSRKA
jgi:hypothetical protein